MSNWIKISIQIGLFPNIKIIHPSFPSELLKQEHLELQDHMASSKTSTESNMDPRFSFIQSAIQGLSGSDLQVPSSLSQKEEIRSFLDDSATRVLRVCIPSFNVSNTIDTTSSESERAVSFVKIGGRQLEPNNMSDEIMITSHGENQTPLRNLYSAVHNLYAPTLLDNDRWSAQLGDKLQELLAKLDTSLGVVVNNENGGNNNDNNNNNNTSSGGRGRGSEEEDLYGSPTTILSITEECEFWVEQTSTGSGRIRSAATRFRDSFEPIATRWSSMDDTSTKMKLSQVLDLLEDTQNALDDVWKVDGLSMDQKYSQSRMEHIFSIVASKIGKHIQTALSKLDLFRGAFSSVRSGLRDSVRVCNKWILATKELTGTFWPTHEDHSWKGAIHEDDYLIGFSKRLSEIGRLRTTYEELCNLLTKDEQLQLRVSDTFVPFDGHKPLRYSRYTQPRWKAAVNQYEELLAPIERHIASNLQKKMSKMASRPQQLLREFQKYRNLISRPNIGQVLMSERQTLLAQLMTHVEHLEGDFESRTNGGRGGSDANPPRGRNVSHQVNCVVWGKQLRNKITQLLKTATPLLKDLGHSFVEFKDLTDALIDKVGKWVKDRVVEWDREMQNNLEDRQLSVKGK